MALRVQPDPRAHQDATEATVLRARKVFRVPLAPEVSLDHWAHQVPLVQQVPQVSLDSKARQVLQVLLVPPVPPASPLP